MSRLATTTMPSVPQVPTTPPWLGVRVIVAARHRNVGRYKDEPGVHLRSNDTVNDTVDRCQPRAAAPHATRWHMLQTSHAATPHAATLQRRTRHTRHSAACHTSRATNSPTSTSIDNDAVPPTVSLCPESPRTTHANTPPFFLCSATHQLAAPMRKAHTGFRLALGARVVPHAATPHPAHPHTHHTPQRRIPHVTRCSDEFADVNEHRRSPTSTSINNDAVPPPATPHVACCRWDRTPTCSMHLRETPRPPADVSRRYSFLDSLLRDGFPTGTVKKGACANGRWWRVFKVFFRADPAPLWLAIVRAESLPSRTPPLPVPSDHRTPMLRCSATDSSTGRLKRPASRHVAPTAKTFMAPASATRAGVQLGGQPQLIRATQVPVFFDLLHADPARECVWRTDTEAARLESGLCRLG
ncbi:hypothetical protein GGX14DRAFT_565247 [Mycena pura]|uniref:Uncharacterized protein n=1 Tax=Mycena pura TaxID=153505 RepID=A0AAD6VFN0_9AGAR|nr:hypothetical protein GGX14DRAFT_565247 [Mycena pura]